jgi:hypothetical protein
MSDPLFSTILPPSDMDAVFLSPNADRLAILGRVDHEKQVVIVMLGNYDLRRVPFAFFRPSGDGIEPDFSRFSVEDCGQTLRFGEYEVDVECFF